MQKMSVRTSSSGASTSSSSSSKKTAYKTESNQVRYTGDWSADSKLSAINNGYWEDPFFKLFNSTDPSKIRRTSLICRGYYVRFRVCDFFLRQILRKINQPIQIVSLGCGQDTTYFRILSDPILENLITRFYELDFKSVITAKKQIILHNEILRVMADDKLRLLHCDLRLVSSLEDALRSSEFDFQKPTLFYSECVVNYLRPNENFKILKWISQNVPNSLWLAYEQCNANDSFGQIMVSHFMKNGCPLLSLISAQSREDQEAQLKKACFDQVKVINGWDAFLRIGTKDPPFFPEVNGREQQFDEYEQLLATCLHYSVRVGINGNLTQSSELKKFLDQFRITKTEQPNEIMQHSSYFKVKSHSLSSLPKLTGHKAVGVLGDGTILIFGGSGESSKRMAHLIASNIDFLENDETNGLKVNTCVLSENPKFYERLHSSAIYVPAGLKEGESADSVLIFGGRKSPLDPCSNDLIEINLESNLSKEDIGSVILSSAYGKCPEPRWRHTMALCTKDGAPFVLLFGGRNAEKILGDTWWYSIGDYSWTERVTTTASEEPTARHSHSLVSDPERNLVYMVGGMSRNDASLCKDAFWTYNSNNDAWAPVPEFNYFSRRIGHVTIKHKRNLILLGGYGADSSHALDLFAVVFNLEAKIIIPITQGIPRDELFLPFGFSACMLNDAKDGCQKVILFGGGGNCFSFGTHFNQVCFSITLDSDIEDWSSI